MQPKDKSTEILPKPRALPVNRFGKVIVRRLISPAQP
jgi:hypothetical protein